MLDCEIKGLKILYPFCMLGIELVLSLDIIQCLMVRIKYKLLSNEIVAPMFQASDDCIEFLIIIGVFSLEIT